MDTETGAGVAVVIVLGLLIFAFAAGNTVLHIMAIVDAVRQPNWVWIATRRSETTWLLLIILVPLCNVIYWFSIRKELKAVAAQGWNPGGPWGGPMYGSPQPLMAPPGYAPAPPAGWPPASTRPPSEPPPS